uniref:Uncharacterized protein n=1 Tax=Gasterosteus aculeatus TaxID=69293 RepID=G3NXQ3_GASAC
MFALTFLPEGIQTSPPSSLLTRPSPLPPSPFIFLHVTHSDLFHCDRLLLSTPFVSQCALLPLLFLLPTAPHPPPPFSVVFSFISPLLSILPSQP